MTYGQQPDPNQPGSNQPGGVPPIPPAPGTQPQQPSAPQAPPSYGSSSAPGGYGAPAAPNQPSAPSYGQYGGAQGAPGAAPWAGTGAPMARPGTVTAGSVLAFIGGGFMAVIGLIFLILGGSGALEGVDVPGFPAGAGSIFAGIGVVFLLMGALVIFFGVMAFKGKRWGAIGLAVLAGLSVIGGISSLSQGDGSGLVGVIWSVVGAVLLLLKSSQEYYRSKA